MRGPMGLLVVHDINLWPIWCNAQVMDDAFVALDEFGNADAEFTAIHPRRARIKLGEMEAFAEVPRGADRVSFEADLRRGTGEFEAWFIDANGEERGAYYVYVTRE